MNAARLGATLLVALSALTVSACGGGGDANAAVKDALRQELADGISTAPAEMTESICSNLDGAVEGVVRTAQLDDEYKVLTADDVSAIAREVFESACQ